MKKIAVVTDGWKKYITYSWIDGLMKAAGEINLDVIVCAFNANGNLSYDKKHNSGEYNMYNLPDYSQFDGIIFDCTNTTDVDEIAWIVDKLKKSGRPVVSISYYVEGFYYVGNDNRTLFRQMIDHLYRYHGVRDMVFAGGPINNYENLQRFRAYCEAMEDYGLPCDESRYMFGDFDFGTGEKYLSEWLEAGKKLPEAFVCANDNIAAGICAEADRRGLRVPEDFKVTGFDNLDKAAYYRPQIATVEHNRGNIIKNGLQILMDIWDGNDADPFTFLYSEVIPGESCGCKNNGRVNYREFAKWQIDWSVVTEKNEDALSAFENKLSECESFEGLFRGFSDYIETKDCDGIYIVVNKGLLSADPANVFPKAGYDRKDMVVAYAFEDGERRMNLHSIRDLNEKAINYGKNRSYVYFPIHFRDDIVGFTVLVNPNFLYDSSYFYNIHSVFITRLESMYKQLQLSNAADKMRELYNRDSLTGLYNRVAYNEMVAPRFVKYTEDKIVCAMAFFDVDYFKDINDTLGHEFGDRVLITIGKVLLETKPKDGFAYRFGGDEFVVVFPYATEKKISNFIEDADRLFRAQNINVSHGVVITDPESGMSLDQYIVMADEKMYELKQGRKRTSGRTKQQIMPRLFDDKKAKFYKGVDISSLKEKLDRKEKFYDAEGKEKDPFDLLKENNIDSVRLRIWNEPANFPESGGYCSLEDTVEMARKIKDHDMNFMLDFHYSDYWADPGQQRKPLAWKDMEMEELEEAVYNYTAEVMERLAVKDCLPDIVQIGNEIRSGMLFPEGEVPRYDNLARLVNAGIRAVRNISSEIKVMIHLDQGGRYYYLKEWFDAMFLAGMDNIDAIGLSFYSFWHGTYMDLRDCMKQLTARYRLPVYIVETAHPWRQCENEHVSEEQMKTAGLPAGIEEQKKALEIIMQIAAECSADMDTGIYYWEPLCLPGRGYGSWDENMGMLDTEGRALPSFEAYKNFNPNEPAISNLDEYIDSLYEIDEDSLPEAGINLVPNGDFAKGIADWWMTKSSDEVSVQVRPYSKMDDLAVVEAGGEQTDDLIMDGKEEAGEVYVSAMCNFKFMLWREIRIEKTGNYRLSLEYRGTNTTGVEISLFLKSISCNGEKNYSKAIFPSDVRFVTHSLDDMELPKGTVQFGIEMNTPPVFGRIRNIRLVEI